MRIPCRAGERINSCLRGYSARGTDSANQTGADVHVGELPGYRWSDGGDSPTWTSTAIAVAATVLLFAAAFVAMTRVRELQERTAEQRFEPTHVITLAPPVAPPIARPRAEGPAAAKPRLASPAPISAVPIRTPVVAQPAVAQPISAAQPPAGAARDSAARARAAEAAQSRSLTELRPPTIGPLGHVPQTLGTPPEPAGVAIHNKKLTLDDIAAVTSSLGAGIAEYVRTHPETAEEKEANSRGSHPPPLQNGPAGDMRRGMTQIPVGSIPFPLFSPGLSPEQRKWNAVIDSEYQWRLRRLEDRAALVRDSVRADSVRRDSVARTKHHGTPPQV
ncbi:MAG TPA: hypothetical protein VHB25_20020 [Gemmatimonadaceae bacterium]|nr:hypothetical protein [Gemmatimonadaceae bacterium]